MGSRGRDLIPVVQKSYDLCANLYAYVNRFPRAQRGLLGRVILEDALQMLVSLTVANRRAEKTETLHEARKHRAMARHVRRRSLASDAIGVAVGGQPGYIACSAFRW
jgi:hypothetical protein